LGFGEFLARLNDSRTHYSKQRKSLPFLPLAVPDYGVTHRDDDDTVQVALVAKRNDSEVYRRL
jgi:hypothetical protein